MTFPDVINSKISDAITQAYTAGNTEALTIIAKLMAEIAQSLDAAKQGENSIEELSVAFEEAEM
jgi:hypothetical protein